jgi:hypothetical protein
VVDRSEVLAARNLYDLDAKYADDVSLEEVLVYLSRRVTETEAVPNARVGERSR